MNARQARTDHVDLQDIDLVGARGEQRLIARTSRSLASLGGVTIVSAWPVFLGHVSAAPLQNTNSWPTPEQAILMVTAYAARVPGTMPSNATQEKSMPGQSSWRQVACDVSGIDGRRYVRRRSGQSLSSPLASFVADAPKGSNDGRPAKRVRTQQTQRGLSEPPLRLCRRRLTVMACRDTPDHESHNRSPSHLQCAFRLARRNRSPGREHAP